MLKAVYQCEEKMRMVAMLKMNAVLGTTQFNLTQQLQAEGTSSSSTASA
jgi:hypothetical protein